MTILLTKDNYDFLIFFFTANGFVFKLDYQKISSLIKDLREYFLIDEKNRIVFMEIDTKNNTLEIYAKFFDGETISDMVDFLRKG